MSKAAPQLDTDDALNPKFNTSALDFLLIELVPLAQRVTEQILAREQLLIDEYKRSKIFNQSQMKDSTTDSQANGVTDGGVKNSSTDGQNQEMTNLGFPAVDEDTQEGIFWRLDGLGYRVGQGLVER